MNGLYSVIGGILGVIAFGLMYAAAIAIPVTLVLLLIKWIF